MPLYALDPLRAYDVYLSKTKDKTFLNKAMSWVYCAIELEPHYQFYDTLAHVLYRQELFSEAEKAQKKAIRLSKNALTTKYLKGELKKIITKQL